MKLLKQWPGFTCGVGLSAAYFMLHNRISATFCHMDGTLVPQWSLVVVGAGSAIVAYIVYRAALAEKRIDRTLHLINKWFEPTGSHLSPDDCLSELGSPTSLGVLNGTFPRGSPEYRKTMQEFIYVHNYFDTAATYLQDKMIDETVFYKHQVYVIRDSFKRMKQFYEFFETSEGLSQERPIAQLLDRSKSIMTVPQS